MPEKITISGRVTEETEERFERFRQNRGLSKSDALRRLIDAGLDAVDDESAESGISAWTPMEQRAVSYLEASIAMWLVSGAIGLATLLIIVLAGLSGFEREILTLVFGLCVAIFLIASAATFLFGGILSMGLASGIEDYLDGIRGPDENQEV